MTEAIRQDYEVSSGGAVRHWLVTNARMEDATPTASLPAAMLSILPGTQLCGTLLVVMATQSIVDFTCSMVYNHEVINTLTYNGGVANTWGAINEGDPIYYDRSATMPAGVNLSTSPADQAAGANALFGYAVLATPTDVYPKGGITTSTHDVAVMQRGAGA